MKQILNITEAVSLALHSMALLAQVKGQKLKVNFIAQQIGASNAHLAKVMQKLAKAGLVDAVSGPEGGYYLAKPGSKITLLEIYEAIEEPFSAHNCLLHNQPCPFKECLLGDLLSNTNKSFKEYLAKHTLEGLELKEIRTEKKFLNLKLYHTKARSLSAEGGSSFCGIE
jgi:Rrf2 family transcriptional regulator, nitric oxide-sensitive transcriptional repressor